MKIWRLSYLIFFLSVSAHANAGYPQLKFTESHELMHGYVQCQWDAEQETRRFHFYTNLPTIYVQSGGCDVSIPPESTDCNLAIGVIGDYFSSTDACQYWGEAESSAAFMCNASKSELITIIYDVCEIMIGL